MIRLQRVEQYVPSKYTAISAFAAILVSVGFVYGKSIGFGFVNFDDSDYVAQNLNVQAGLTWEGLRWAFTTFHGANWFPVTWLSHMIDAQLFGPWPGGHHLTSVLLHGANSLLLAGLLFRMTGAWWKSCLAAALFALHPLHVESVVWVSERKDVLSTFFFLTALFGYVRYTERRSIRRYLTIILPFAIGLMAKPMLVSLPLVLLLLDWWPLQRFSSSEGTLLGGQGTVSRLKMLVYEKVPLLLLSLASAVVTVVAQRHGEALVSPDVLPVIQRLQRVFIHYAWYLEKLAWPSDLAFYYPVSAVLPFWKVSAAAAFITALLIVAFRKAHTEPFLTTGVLWFLVTLLPVIGLVAVGMQGTADRYAYIPSIGIVIAFLWLVDRLLERTNVRLLAAIIATAVLAVLTVLTWRQVDVWRDSYTLSSHAVDVTRDNYVALTILGDSLDDSGNSQEAIIKYSLALQIRPEYDVARNSLGVALCKQGRTDDAMRVFHEAVRLRPSYADAYVNMGVCVSGLGKLAEAASYFHEALKIKPDHFAAAMYLEQVMPEIISRRPAVR